MTPTARFVALGVMVITVTLVICVAGVGLVALRAEKLGRQATTTTKTACIRGNRTSQLLIDLIDAHASTLTPAAASAFKAAELPLVAPKRAC